eukprot:IDg21442t1
MSGVELRGSKKLASLRSNMKEERDAKKNEEEQLRQETSIYTKIEIQERCGQIQGGDKGIGKIGANEVSTLAESSAMDVASFAQALKPYESEEQYETLIDPFSIPQKELCEYESDAIEQYENVVYSNLKKNEIKTKEASDKLNTDMGEDSDNIPRSYINRSTSNCGRTSDISKMFRKDL